MLQCILAGCVTHGCIRTDIGSFITQVIYTGLAYQRNAGISGVKAETVFFQPVHDTVRSSQSIGRTSGQDNSIDGIVGSDRRGERSFSGSRATSAYIAACFCSIWKIKNSYTGLRIMVRSMTDA